MDQTQLIDIFNRALKAADPYDAVLRHVSLADDILSAAGDFYDLKEYQRIVVVGAGKGSAAMAQAIEQILGDRIDQGIVVVKYGHTRPLRTIVLREAGHPLPDEAGVKATAEIRDLLNGADERTLVICLLSGGASSLLVAPVEGISLDDKRVMTDLLLKSGAVIDEINSIRKHLSSVKGGRLAETASPATIMTLILSDVIGDRIDVIASGPTAPDPTSFRDALGVVHRYSLERKIPNSVYSLLHLGRARLLADTPKKDAAFFQKTRNVIIGSIVQSIAAAQARAAELGFEPEIVATELQGEARNAAAFLANRAIEVRSAMNPGDNPPCLLSGGETTVTVKGTGRGGRNQELALAFALAISGRVGITLLSAGTDGTDGPTDAAGAVVDDKTIVKARSAGLYAVAFLDNNDSYTFFKELDLRIGGKHHIVIGPTGTNVMDIQIILVEAK